MNRILNQNGFSILEVILSAGIFLIFSTAAVVLVISALESNRLGNEETIATQYTAEGMEAVRSIRNRSWVTLTSKSDLGNQGLAAGVGGAWDWNGMSNSLPSDPRFIRSVSISCISRDGAGNISSDIVCSNPSSDPNTRKIRAVTNWSFSSARQKTTDLISYLTDWKSAIDTAPSGGPIMMAYSKTTTTPFYRLWDGTTWGSESSAQVVGGNINYIVLKSSRTRNEAVLGTLDSNGNIYAQVWNGTSWGTPTLMANITAALSVYRSFDLAYEKSGDRVVLTYLPTSTSTDFAYRVWDGNSWSPPTTVTAPPTTGVVRWIDMTQNPISTSNEIALIMLDANIDIYGMAWNGSTWGTMGTAAVWDASGSIATKKSIDVAYEQNSGRAVFIWGDSVATDQYYRIWNGTTLTSPTLLDVAAAGGVVHWMELVSRPNSNELLYASVDAGSDLNTRKWSGSAWDSATQHPEHSAGVENITSMVFDVIWETHTVNPGKAWLVYGDGATVTKKQWSGTAWGAASVLTGSDDSSFIRLKADPISGAVFAGIYESAASATDDIWESRLTGGSSTWSSKNSIWGGPTSAEPSHFKIDIAIP